MYAREQSTWLWGSIIAHLLGAHSFVLAIWIENVKPLDLGLGSKKDFSLNCCLLLTDFV